MKKIFKQLLSLAMVAGLVACGGGGGSPGGTNQVSPALTPSSVELLTSVNSLASAGSEAEITAVVKNANNVGLGGQAVEFAVDSGILLVKESVTDANGVATARLSAGQDKSLRLLTVSVKAGKAVGTIALPVTGTRLSLTTAGTVKIGEVTTFTARLLDSAGNGIAGKQIAVASSLGNGISQSSLTTDINGQAFFIYTANRIGTDTVTLSGLGTSVQSAVNVSGVNFIVESPAANQQVMVGTPQTITVRYADASGTAQGLPVSFSTTRGVLTPASGQLTDANGRASVTISSSSAGPAVLVAQIAGGQVTLPLHFIATNPASLVLQANPGAVLPNSAGGKGNQSTLEAVVRDGSGNPVANRQVNFTVLKDDGNGGTLTSPTATTDLNGRAEVQFIPGSASTSADGVVFEATVSGTSVTSTAALTVNGNALFISIGFGNEITNNGPTIYKKDFSVYVTDAAGNAVADQLITLSTIPVEFGKGQLKFGGSPAAWNIDPDNYVGNCKNEDVNRNGRLDDGEDTDGDRQLTPGNPVVVTPGSVRTNAQGRATFSLEYGEQYVPWLSIDLIARGSVAGTESRSTLRFELRGSASDLSDEGVPPAGVKSPFGTTLSCYEK